MRIIFLVLIGLAVFGPQGFSQSGVVKKEVLYNGIELSSPWPPLRTSKEMKSLEPMAVPYLKNGPRVVPIDLGRQLFIDDFLIESTDLKRRFYQPKYHEKSPVLKPEMAWEKSKTAAFAAPFSDGVWFDSKQKMFMMWYRSATGRTCLALSEDGVEWKRPELDLEPTSNVVLKSNRDAATVVLDHQADDEKERFKLFEARTKKSPYHIALRVSADGKKWSDEVKVSGPSWDRSTIFYNPFRSLWVASIRGHDHVGQEGVHRLRCYREANNARDVLGWTQHTDLVAKGDYIPGDLQPWVAADKLDPRNPDPRFKHIEPQLYNLDVFPYESLLVGLFTIWQGPDNETCQKLGIHKRNEVLVGFSRDGFHWDRSNRERFLGVSEDPKAWNAGNVQSVGGGCLVVGDKLYFYCSGRTMQPADSGATGLATMRRDGFASMDAGDVQGSLTTKLLKFSGANLFVNLESQRGGLQVEVMDEQGKVIEEFSRDKCLPLVGDSAKMMVRWRGGKDLSSLAGKPVRLRFYLTKGSLYSFWVGDAKGASNGYVGAGGPGFGNNQDK
ncbi:MAG: hypothetical protein DWH70_09160 [Planctomycetota bacterium]|nr:MAG: hypothetical protein DWH70_09160 [Planctomycetota bacterium]